LDGVNCTLYTLCKRGSKGRLCSSCAKDFYTDGDQCKPCIEEFALVFWALGSVPIIIGILALIVVKLTGKLSLPSAAWPPLTIGLAFWQILSLHRQIRFDWPPPMRTMFEVVSISNFNVDVIQTECTVPMAHLTKLYLVMMLPSAFWLAANLLMLIAVSCRNLAQWCRGGNAEWSYTKVILTSTSIAWTVFTVSFVSVVNRAFEAFACAETPSGLSLLQADPNIVCGSEIWVRWYALPAACWLVVYLAFPVCLLLFLRRKCSSGEMWSGDTFTSMAWAVVYRRYKRDMWAWELVVLGRKFMIIGCIKLLNLYPFRAAVLFASTLIVSLIGNIVYEPFEAPENNKLDSVVLIFTSLVSFTAICVFSPTALSREVSPWIVQTAVIVDISSITLISLLVLFVVIVSVVVVVRLSKHKTFDDDLREQTQHLVGGIFDKRTARRVLLDFTSKQGVGVSKLCVHPAIADTFETFVVITRVAAGGELSHTVSYRGIVLPGRLWKRNSTGAVDDFPVEPLQLHIESVHQHRQHCLVTLENGFEFEMSGDDIPIAAAEEQGENNARLPLVAALTVAFVNALKASRSDQGSVSDSIVLTSPLSPKDTINAKERHQDIFNEAAFGAVIETVLDVALARGLLEETERGWFVTFPHWSSSIALVGALAELGSINENWPTLTKSMKQIISQRLGLANAFDEIEPFLAKVYSRGRMDSKNIREELRELKKIAHKSGVVTSKALCLAAQRTHAALTTVLSAYQRLLCREEAVATLRSSLYSLFLFIHKQRLTRQFGFGPFYQRVLGLPKESTLAGLTAMDVIQNGYVLEHRSSSLPWPSLPLSSVGSVSYTALWLDQKASDKERMLVLGFFDLVRQLEKVKPDSDIASRDKSDTDSDTDSEDPFPDAPDPEPPKCCCCGPRQKPEKLRMGFGYDNSLSEMGGSNAIEGDVEMTDLPNAPDVPEENTEPDIEEEWQRRRRTLSLWGAEEEEEEQERRQEVQEQVEQEEKEGEQEEPEQKEPGDEEEGCILEAATASTQALATHEQQLDGHGDHVLDQGAGSSGTPSRWHQVSELGSVGIKAAKFGLLNKRKAQQARAVSAMTRK
jgi:hypothetical protein